MTSYEQGFLTKCAEYGIKEADARVYLANYGPEMLGGALLGGGIGALTSRDKDRRIRNAIIGALLGTGAAATARYSLAGKTIGRLNEESNKYNELSNGLKNTAGVSLKKIPLSDLRLPYSGGLWKADHLTPEQLLRVIKPIVPAQTGGSGDSGKK